VKVRVNGEERELLGPVTVADLLEQLKLRPDGIAVAVDRQVVPRSEFARRPVEEGQQIEILRAVGGG
jgi:thiamine biosynthesis protein ThiS